MQAKWLRYASEDLAMAELSTIVPRISCFHAQQAAETAMKATLLVDDVVFPKTHDLNRLHTLLPRPDWLAMTAIERE